ncbi:hypothetical protein IL306_007202 [Fusarium sp. DS 682]|nr:hypothetical protein IL306_007202 [Fusarium sp. DS 682]
MLPLTVFFIWAFLAWTALYPHYNPYSYYYVGVTVVVIITLRDTFHLEMNLGWALAWAQFFLSMHFVLVPGMRLIWNATWLALLASLWFLLRPSNGWVFFLLFSTIAASQRWVIYVLYLHYWLHPDKSALPPFSFFARFLRRPKNPLKRPDSSANRNINYMCIRCRGVIYASRLIMGSSLPIVWLTEWYDHYDKIEQLQKSAKAVPNDSNTLSSSCFVCNLLLLSLSDKGMEAARVSAECLRIKVWDERPLSLHTYVQLHVGKYAVGARLLVERGSSVQIGMWRRIESVTRFVG